MSIRVVRVATGRAVVVPGVSSSTSVAELKRLAQGRHPQDALVFAGHFLDEQRAVGDYSPGLGGRAGGGREGGGREHLRVYLHAFKSRAGTPQYTI